MLFLFLRERETETERESVCVSLRGAEREGDTEFEAGSRLPAAHTEPNVGLEPINGDLS